MLRSALLLLLIPAVAFAQTPDTVRQVDAKIDAERAAQRNEDIEILRRLLNKACGFPNTGEVRPYREPSQSTAVLDPHSALAKSTALFSAEHVLSTTRMVHNHTTVAAVGPFDGVYLPGAGVVFTLHVPAGVLRTQQADRIGLNSSCNTCHQPSVHVSITTQAAPVSLTSCTTCHTEMPKGEPALSEWDRVKQDVRGEHTKPVETPKSERPRPMVCEPGNLPTLITGVLAANAKHVRHLGEKEGISVVITFDEATGVGKPASVAVGSGIHPALLQGGYSRGASDEMIERHFKPVTKPGFIPDEVKALSLGDLHLKQGKHQDAAEAYGTALARFTEKEFRLSGLAHLTPEQRNQYAEEFQAGVRDAMKSYAKALVLADQPEKARHALELATGFLVLEVTPTTVPAKSTAPAKMVLTVSKSAIDQAKEQSAFKKAVKVERLNFPEAEKK